jgi:hypothetical protein
MKKIKILIFIALVFDNPAIGLSQTLNWANLRKDQKHILTIQAGVEYGVIFGAGYGNQLRSKIPIVLNADYSFPTGKRLFDDFKTKTGAQIRFYQTGDIHFSAKLYGLFRGYENDFARLINFGSDISATVGYYKTKWFVAGEAGFDKAIVTHFKHTESYKALYPMVRDGWYEPSTGENFHFGLQLGCSFNKKDFFLKAGKIVIQDFQSQPLVPFTFQMGFNFKITR